MHIILVYDINAKKVNKALKICRQYLVHVQKSVFEGNITQANLDKLKKQLANIIDKQKDSVIIYRLDSPKYIGKEQIDVIEDNSNII